MKLGILVNTKRHKDHILGIVNAAVSKGHSVIIFGMDEGTKLLEDADFTALHKLNGVSMSYCDHSAHNHNVNKEGIPAEIVGGSQLNNAYMNNDADKVIVL